jgi:hypothetical protein
VDVDPGAHGPVAARNDFEIRGNPPQVASGDALIHGQHRVPQFDQGL